MSASREAQRTATRRAIIDAAIQVFARHGFDGASFRDITDLCGIRRSLILYHFQSKEELWTVAIQEVERRFSAVFEDAYSPESHHEDEARIRHAMSAFMDTLGEVPEYGQIFLREGVASGPRMEWLASHFVPRRALRVPLSDKDLEYRTQKTVLRDILACTLVAFTALGPLLEKSLAVAIREPSAGIYPLSPERKKEFLDYMMRLVARP